MAKKRSKQYKVACNKVDSGREYDIPNAIALIRELSFTKFDGSLEGHFKISYKSVQSIKGGFLFPHGVGKKVKVLVFAKGDKASDAREVGADHVGDDDLIRKIKDGWIDFEFVVSTPDMMLEVKKLGPTLGKKGLMPKPKSGTVTTDVISAVKKLKSGWLEYKADKNGVIHMGMGKMSFSPEHLQENAWAAYQAIIKEKPSDAKGQYVSSFFLSGTMTPSVKIDLKNIKN